MYQTGRNGMRVGIALGLIELPEVFDNVIHCGLFHVFSHDANIF